MSISEHDLLIDLHGCTHRSMIEFIRGIRIPVSTVCGALLRWLVTGLTG
jgi:hypothetical protein